MLYGLPFDEVDALEASTPHEGRAIALRLDGKIL